eukprot:GHVT01093854.1.p2 GENE.GHVT01093854.1~~GHVT01093854.1.p2  ORF type:complete len:128 (-),score=26.61 GHVT01093854.1:297-680(-)
MDEKDFLPHSLWISSHTGEGRLGPGRQRQGANDFREELSNNSRGGLLLSSRGVSFGSRLDSRKTKTQKKLADSENLFVANGRNFEAPRVERRRKTNTNSETSNAPFKGDKKQAGRRQAGRSGEAPNK